MCNTQTAVCSTNDLWTSYKTTKTLLMQNCLLTVETNVDFLWDRGSAVCIGCLTHKLGAQVFPLEVRVSHGVDDSVVVSGLVWSIIDTSLPPPCDTGPGPATTHFTSQQQLIPHLIIFLCQLFGSWLGWCCSDCQKQQLLFLVVLLHKLRQTTILLV